MKKICIFLAILLLAAIFFTISDTNVLAADRKWKEYREKIEECLEEYSEKSIPSIKKYYKAEGLFMTHVGAQTGRICWDECCKKYSYYDEYDEVVACYRPCAEPIRIARDQARAELNASAGEAKDNLQLCLTEAWKWYEGVKQEDYSQFCDPTVHKERAEILEIAGKWELEECKEKVETCNEEARTAREEFIKQGNEVYNQVRDYLNNCAEKCLPQGISGESLQFWNELSECTVAYFQVDALSDYTQDNERIVQELEKVDSDFEACIAEVEDWYETIEEKVINNYLSRDISGEKIVFQVWGLEGNVYVKPKGQDEWYKLKKGYRLIEGDIVRTTKNGMIGFKDSRGTRIEMDTNTQIEMKELEEARRFYRVHAGITRFKVPKKGEAWQEIIIKTPTCLVGAYGTDFIVKVDETGNTSVFVLDGEVKVSDINNKETVVVKPGQVSEVEYNTTPSQPQEYKEEEVRLILEELKIKRGIPIWGWIIVGVVVLIIVGAVIILIKKKQKK